MSLENAKMGSKVKVSDYAYFLEEKYHEPKFRELLSYALCDIEDDNSIEEIKESVEEALEKFEELKVICIARNDALMALDAYGNGLDVRYSYVEKAVADAKKEIMESYDNLEIVKIRDRYMEELRSKAKKGPKR